MIFVKPYICSFNEIFCLIYLTNFSTSSFLGNISFFPAYLNLNTIAIIHEIVNILK